MGEAPTLSEKFSTIAETAADAAHRHPQIQQEQELLAEDPTKNQVIEVKHEAKRPPSRHKDLQHKDNKPAAELASRDQDIALLRAGMQEMNQSLQQSVGALYDQAGGKQALK
eukprot:IDg22227t1